MRNTIATVFITLFVLLTLGSCGGKKELANQQKASSEVTIPDPELQQVIIDQGFVPPRKNGNFNMESMEVVGNTLTLNVSYSGGCEAHEFKLYSKNQYAKSYPPQLTLFLEHIDNGDNCRALIYKDLVFDISEVQYLGTNTLILYLNNTEETLKYKY